MENIYLATHDKQSFYIYIPVNKYIKHLEFHPQENEHDFGLPVIKIING